MKITRKITRGITNEQQTNNKQITTNKNIKNIKNIKEDKNNNISLLEETSRSDTAKANTKHKYGEYKNVLLKDEELQALQKDYPNWETLIKYLDEYIEMKGYKAKSHYLCIKKWVVDAVKKNHKETEEEKRARKLKELEDSLNESN